MICAGVGFGSVGGGGLISIGVILVGNNMVNGCSGVGLGFNRGLLCFVCVCVLMDGEGGGGVDGRRGQ